MTDGYLKTRLTRQRHAGRFRRDHRHNRQRRHQKSAPLAAAFSYSNMQNVVAMLSEKVECAREGLVPIFDHISMAPRASQHHQMDRTQG